SVRNAGSVAKSSRRDHRPSGVVTQRATSASTTSRARSRGASSIGAYQAIATSTRSRRAQSIGRRDPDGRAIVTSPPAHRAAPRNSAPTPNLPAMPDPDLTPVVDLLERQRADDLHDCAQAYVSLEGTVLLDTAIGETRPGRDARVDDLMLWYSSSKPVTTVAVLQLWEQGRLALDDPVAKYVEGWGAGKERATLRHVLTHTGGFPMLSGGETFDLDLPYADAVAR